MTLQDLAIFQEWLDGLKNATNAMMVTLREIHVVDKYSEDEVYVDFTVANSWCGEKEGRQSFRYYIRTRKTFDEMIADLYEGRTIMQHPRDFKEVMNVSPDGK